MKVQTYQKLGTLKILNWTALGLFILFTLYMTLGQNQDYLKKLQYLDLFLFNDLFFMDSVKQVGGLSMYLSSFLLQFFYYPLAGFLLLLLLLLVVNWFTAKIFNLSHNLLPLAFIPSLALMLTQTELGYMIYFQKIDGDLFNNILGIIIALLGLKSYQKIKRAPLKVLFVPSYIFIAYPLFGSYALFGGLLMLLV